jgi:prepilin-type N-terminal cleavage/methylation domain-containing protein
VRARRTLAGFSLIEVMVATLLLSVVALALTQTLVGALHMCARNERWMLATQLAAEGIEQLRAGHVLGPVEPSTGFERTGTTAPWSGHLGVVRLDVSVTWNDGEPHSFQLATLARQ